MRDLIAASRRAGIVTASGVFAGIIVGGLLGRVVMRLVGIMAGPEAVGAFTANGNRVGDITFVGTLAIVIFIGAAGGAVGGTLYAIVEPWFARLTPWHGALFGLALLAAFGFVFITPDNPDFARFGRAPVNVLLFALLIVVYGIATVWIAERLVAATAGGGAAAWVLAALGWLGIAFVVLLVLQEAGRSVDAGSAILFVVVALGLLLVRWRRWPALLGYAGIGAAIVFGSIQLSGSLPSILGG